MTVAQRLHELGLALPSAPSPVANYVSAVRTGNLVFLSGHSGRRADGSVLTGKLGRDVTLEQGYEAARDTMLNCLATLQKEIGDLEKVTRIVKLLGMVNSTEDFGDHPKVINGASDLLVAVFGDRGRHARSAVGMQMLPNNIAVEIEMVVEVAPA